MRLLYLLLCWSTTVRPTDIRSVTDGDTFRLWPITVWPNIAAADERVRILGVDTPERGQVGVAEAQAFTAQWLARGDFKLDACKRDSFGRLLAVPTRGTDTLAVSLVNAGHGVRSP